MSSGSLAAFDAPHLSVRGGLPHFSERARSRGFATVVAFGTSITAGGRYLHQLVPALASALPGVEIRFINRGRNGFNSFLAVFEAGEVAALDPDLVLLEFSISDLGGTKEALVPHALGAIIRRIRRRRPTCAFALVYCCREADAPAWPTSAARAHNAFAERNGLPSIDLGACAIALVRDGRADWRGAPERALTVDGVHPARASEMLLGEPFADALRALVQAEASKPPAPTTAALRFDAGTYCRWQRENTGAAMSAVAMGLVRPARPSATSAHDFARGERVPIRALRPNHTWRAGTFDDRFVDTLGGWNGQELFVAVDAGATLAFTLEGTFAMIVGLSTGGALRLRQGNLVQHVQLARTEPHPIWWPLVVLADLDDGRHDVEITTLTPLIALRDVFALGSVRAG